jgi:nitrogen fixation NifU-like protein
MMDLRELYQEVILDHNRRPRNFGTLEEANRTATGHNPLCGDSVRVYLVVEDNVIKDVRFDGTGCAISRASASMMTDAVKGKTIEEVKQLFSTFHEMVTGHPGQFTEAEEMGKLGVFAGVCEFPARVKCASLAWHTLNAALEARPEPVSTE